MLSNLSRWESEKPEWFTAAFNESVPDDTMPKKGLEELSNEVGFRRRSNVVSEDVGKSLLAVTNTGWYLPARYHGTDANSNTRKEKLTKVLR